MHKIAYLEKNSAEVRNYMENIGNETKGANSN